jgi:anti-anti-sigma factor
MSTNSGVTPLAIGKRTAGEVPVAVLLGRITLGESSRALGRCVGQYAAQRHKSVLLDMNGVSFVDSSGLGALVAAYNALKNSGGTLSLIRVPDRILELLELSRLRGVLPVYGSEAEALEAN